MAAASTMIVPTEDAPAAARVHFSVTNDLSLLRDVQASDPFRDPAQWTKIAERLSSDTGKPFAARAVRDRCQNLMALYAANDRKNLRKSGTEEEYNERDHILQDLICLANGTTFTFKVRAHRRARTAPRGPTSAAAARRAAEAARRDAAESIVVLSAPEEDENSNSGIDTASNFAESPSGIFAAMLPTSLAQERSSSASNDQHAEPPATPSVSSESSGNAHPATSPRSTPRQRKKDLEADHEFLLKRMKHEADMQRREHEMESRRLALEESRLEWDKQRTLMEQEARDEERKRQVEREEEERRARAEERRTHAAQQQAMLNILDGILSRLNK